jgi:hypothetical protein
MMSVCKEIFFSWKRFGLPAIVVGTIKKKETQSNEFCEVCIFKLGDTSVVAGIGIAV